MEDDFVTQVIFQACIYMLAACKGYNNMSKMFLYLLTALLLEGCGEVSLCKTSVGIWDMMNCIG